MFVLRTNHTFVLRINLVVLRITTRGVLSVIFDSLQVSIDPRHARCPNLNPFDPGRFPYFPDERSLLDFQRLRREDARCNGVIRRHLEPGDGIHVRLLLHIVLLLVLLPCQVQGVKAAAAQVTAKGPCQTREELRPRHRQPAVFGTRECAGTRSPQVHRRRGFGSSTPKEEKE
jgi:hypothetical protein